MLFELTLSKVRKMKNTSSVYMVNRIYLIAFCLCFSASVLAQNSLILHLFGDSKKSIELNSINKITFSSGNMIVDIKGNSSESIGISDIKLMSFGVVSGIGAIGKDERRLSIFPNPASNFINVSKLFPQELELNIISLDGRCLLQKTITRDTEVIDISSLKSGVYLLKSEGLTLKLIKR